MIPEQFKNRMKNMLGKEYDAFIESYHKTKLQALRINPLKGNSDAVFRAFSGSLSEVKWCDTGYYYEDTVRPGKHPYHEAGAYYIQEPSAMAPAEYLDVRAGDIVLDLCAAPGGKSTQIAGKMNGEGLLISNEIIPSRAKILSENIERMGIKNAVVTNESPDRLAEFFPEFFDKIMVDAPCSGEGMFRKNSEACDEWSPDNVVLCAKRQAQILDNAACMLKPGGRLVYSTCTFSPEENEGSVIHFLLRHRDFKLVEVKKYDGMSDGQIELARGCIDTETDIRKNNGTCHANSDSTGSITNNMIDNATDNTTDDTTDNTKDFETALQTIPFTVRLFPHKLNGEGHFIAVFEKCISSEKEANPKRAKVIKGVKDKSIAQYMEFCKENLNVQLKGTPIMFGNQLYMVPEMCPPLDKIKVLRCGLHLGTFLKNRFEPSHSLALALSASDVKNVLTLSAKDDAVYQYINGETLDCEGQKGWYLIVVDGYSLGFGKLSGGIMKNHYPKGLRKKLSL